MPLLKDYLKSEDRYVLFQFLVGSSYLSKVHDMSPPGSSTAEGSPVLTEAKVESEDYVWDVFYHKPTKLSEWNAVANIGTLCVHFSGFCMHGLFVVLFLVFSTQWFT